MSGGVSHGIYTLWHSLKETSVVHWSKKPNMAAAHRVSRNGSLRAFADLSPDSRGLQGRKLDGKVLSSMAKKTASKTGARSLVSSLQEPSEGQSFFFKVNFFILPNAGADLFVMTVGYL